MSLEKIRKLKDQFARKNYLHKRFDSFDKKAMLKSVLVIVSLLVFQSAISPVLTHGVGNIYDLTRGAS